MFKFEYDIKYDKDRPQIDWDGKLDGEIIFFIYEACKYLVSDLYYREKEKKYTDLNEEALDEIKTTFITLDVLSNIAAKILLEENNRMKEVDDILNKKNDDETN